MNFNPSSKQHQDRVLVLPRVGTSLQKPRLGVFPVRRGVPYGEQTLDRGYVCGGSPGGVASAVVDRFVGRGETMSTVAAGLPTTYQQGGVGVNSLYKGYMMGGSTTPGSNTGIITAMPFNTEVTVNIAATLGTARRSNISAGFCNPLGSGYNAGGFTTGSVNIIDALKFASETNTTLTATLSTIAADGCGVASSDAGYLVGGWTVSPTGQRNTTDKVAFNTSTVSTIAALLNSPLSGIVGVQSGARGYMMGGNFDPAGGPSGPPVATIHSLAFPQDTISVLGATLDVAQSFGTGWSLSTRGYYHCGFTAVGNPASIDNMIYATETSVTISTTMINGHSNACSFNTPVNL